MNRLFLLDAMALAYRAHFAFINRPLINSKGFDTSAVYGFTGALLRLLETENPEHIAVVFDPPGGTFRDEMFQDYKAHRAPMPDGLRAGIPFIKEIVKGFDIPVVEVQGFEADDVIGTLAKQAEAKDVEVIIVSPDKDFRQLLSPHISIMRPARQGEEFERMTIDKFREEYGVEPHQFIDILALLGDTADNVPGVQGIGAKTAPTLIQEYGSVENLLQHADEIKAKRVREGLQNDRENAILSKVLVTIMTDVDLGDLEWDDLIRTAPKVERLHELFDEMEFRGYKQRVAAQKRHVEQTLQGDLFGMSEILQTTYHSDEKGFDESAVEYQMLTDLSKINDFKELITQKVSFDTETTSIDPMMASLVGVSMSIQEKAAVWMPTPAPNGTSTEAILADLKPILENPSIEKIGQNIKYDYLVMKRHGVEVGGDFFDTMVAHYLLAPDAGHGIDAMAKNLLDYDKIPTSALLGSGKSQRNMRDLFAADIKNYACEDADIALRLSEILRNQLEKDGLTEIATTVEFPLIKVLAEMEFAGVQIDAQKLAEYSVELGQRMDDLQQQIYEEAGQTFNIASPKQLGEILFGKLQIKSKKKTATGQASTNEQVLTELATEHSLPALVLDWRKLQKLKSTYVDALPQLVHPETGRVHTQFNQTVTATGRLSSTNPNLQNIPVRSADGREIRKAFVARSGYQILSADYAQIELRIIASMSGDEGFAAAFRANEDIHTATAARVFGVEQEAVTHLQRSKAKEVNFGIPYGISPFGLAQRMRIPTQEAKALIDAYNTAYPKVAYFNNQLIESAKEKGYAETLMKRRRYLPELRSSNRMARSAAERVAVNMPIQGTQADMIKIAMIRIFERFQSEKLASKMILQVHDELLFEVLPEELEVVKGIVKHEMENALPLEVPIEVGMGVGENWLDAH